MITEIYRLAVTSEGVDCARLISDWHEYEAVRAFGDFSDFCDGEPAGPIIYEPL